MEAVQEPIGQIIKTVEHKIRNLDKRKSKLEGYQDLRTSGKNLTADQEIAISKYEEVVQCLLCAQEFLKQIQNISTSWEKEQKNVLRKVSGTRAYSNKNIPLLTIYPLFTQLHL